METVKSEFNNDIKCEREFNKFTVKYLWKRLEHSNLIYSYSNVEDAKLQKSGVDIFVESNKGEFIIDEKLAAHYINRNLCTFAFELFYSSGNTMKTGWFLNKDIKTTHYSIYWANSINDDYKTVKCDDFSYSDAFIIKKDRMKIYLEKMFGLTNDRLREIGLNIIKSGKFGRIPFNNTRDFFFFRTEKLKEQPLNIVMDKNILRKLSEACFEITKESTKMTKDRSEFLNSMKIDNTLKADHSTKSTNADGFDIC